MTPEQHAARAEELVAEAEELYSDLRFDVEADGDVDQTIWGFLDTTVKLDQLHATLALRHPIATRQELRR
jgi:hypothetical protein